MPDPGTPFPWDRLRTDLRFPDPAWAFAGLEPGTPAHPVSGLGLHFLSRGCPAPRVRVRFLAPRPAGSGCVGRGTGWIPSSTAPGATYAS